MERFYIYCHRKKTDGKCFYIGKGTGNRFKSKNGRNQYWHNIVNKHGFEVIILINNINEEKTFEYESYFCKQIGYENLCNIRKELGNGGYSMSEETKQKISKRKINHSCYNNEWKEKIHENNKKEIFQYDLKNNFIKEWSSIKEAGLSLNKKGAAIGECCQGKRKTSYKYIWKFKINQSGI